MSCVADYVKSSRVDWHVTVKYVRGDYKFRGIGVKFVGTDMPLVNISDVARASLILQRPPRKGYASVIDISSMRVHLKLLDIEIDCKPKYFYLPLEDAIRYLGTYKPSHHKSKRELYKRKQLMRAWLKNYMLPALRIIYYGRALGADMSELEDYVDDLACDAPGLLRKMANYAKKLYEEAQHETENNHSA